MSESVDRQDVVLAPDASARLTVISGPAGVGKGTLVNRLKVLHPEVWVSVSATTRAPRPGEIEGRHYLFVGDGDFERLIAQGELLEWAVVHGAAKYGTPRAPVLRTLEAGRPAILEIDLQGARQIRSSWPESRFVFLKPPSWSELTRRLTDRGTETPAQRERRLDTARDELSAMDEFEHVIVNDDIDRAVGELVELLRL